MTRPAAPTAIARTDSSDLAKLTPEIVSEMTGYDERKLRLITRTVAKDAPLIELASFLLMCNKLHLDPLLKQAYWIRRKNRELVDGNWQDVLRGTMQIGIDGFRALADRQGNYIGSDTAEFRDWFELKDTKTGEMFMAPGYARVITRKVVQGHVGTFVGEARWREFYPGDAAGSMWRKMPTLMLAKCAEAQSLRKGWPALLGGVEMMNDEPEAVDLIELPAPRTQVEPAAVPVSSVAQAQREAEAYARAYVEDDFPTSYNKRTVTAPPAPTRRAQPNPPETEPEASPDSGDAETEPDEVDKRRQALLGKYAQFLTACKRALGDDLVEADWVMDDDASIEEIEASSQGLQELLEQAGEKKPAARQPAASGGERF